MIFLWEIISISYKYFCIVYSSIVAVAHRLYRKSPSTWLWGEGGGGAYNLMFFLVYT